MCLLNGEQITGIIMATIICLTIIIVFWILIK